MTNKLFLFLIVIIYLATVTTGLENCFKNEKENILDDATHNDLNLLQNSQNY